jgi:GC-rich sequence DNA-binding factor
VEQRAAASTERRRFDVEDEATMADAAISAALSCIANGYGNEAATAAASAASQLAADAATRSVGADVDEFGRDRNLGQRMERQQRRASRKSRRERADKRRALRAERTAQADMRELGETSSEESEGELATYQRQLSEVGETAEGVFSDAALEFRELQYVKNKLEQWKQRYERSYKDAYVALSAPALFAPYVRLELLTWSPLYSAKGLDAMDWYSQLFDYGMPSGGGEHEADDPDAELVPKLVEKVALPVVHHAVECWEPLSYAQTLTVSAAVKEVLIYVQEETCEEMKEVVTLVHLKLVGAVAAVALPPWPAAAMAAAGGAAQLAARRFGQAVSALGFRVWAARA